MDWIHLEKNQPKTENVPLVPLDGKSNIMKILHGTNETAIKDLIINSKDNQLKTNLHFLNMEGTRSENVAIRRETNKKFMVCLMQIQIDKPSTLAWMKGNNEFDTCRRMISDWKFSGEHSFCIYFQYRTAQATKSANIHKFSAMINKKVVIFQYSRNFKTKNDGQSES